MEDFLEEMKNIGEKDFEGVRYRQKDYSTLIFFTFFLKSC